MPPRGYRDMVAERTATRKPRTKTAQPTTRTERTSDPRDMEMSARASRVGRGRQMTGAAPGGSRTGGSGLFTIQDMERDPAVEWSRNMARGPAQGKVDSITADVMGKLAEQGLTRDETGTWGIDFAKNTAYREGRRGTSGIPSAPSLPTGPASNIPSGGGFPGPAKPPGTTNGRPPVPPTSGGSLPPGTIPRQTGGTIPRQTGTPGTAVSTPAGGPIYEPGKPPAPVTSPISGVGGIPSPGLGGGSMPPNPRLPIGTVPGLGGGFPTGTEVSRAASAPPKPWELPVVQSPTETQKPAATGPGANGITPAPGMGGGFPSTVTPNIGMRQPSPGTQVSTPAYVHPASAGNTVPPPPVAAGQQGPGWTGGIGYAPANTTGKPPEPQGYSGYAHPDASITPGTPSVQGVTPTGPNERSLSVQPPTNAPSQGLPPGTLPRQGQPQQPQGKPPQPTQIPGRSPQGMPQMPQRPSSGSNNQLGGDIQAQVAAMISGIQQRVQGQSGQVGQSRTGGLEGLSGLGDRIRGQVEGMQRDMGMAQGRGGVRPVSGVTTGLSGLGDRIQQQVQAGLGGMRRPSLPQPGVSVPGQVSPTNPGGQGGPPPGPGGIPQPPGGPAPGNPSPAPPTGPGTSNGTLGSYGNPTVDQWDDAFIAAGNKYGVDPTLLKAMMEIESGGNGNLPLDQCRADGSCGPMQIKPEYWGQSASVPEQIDKAAKILADGVASGQYATPRDALFGIYFPTDDVMNGTTQGQYGAKVDQLMGQMGPYNPNTVQPAPGGTIPVQQLPNTGTGPGTQTSTLDGAKAPEDIQQGRLTSQPIPGADATAPVGPNDGQQRIPSTTGVVNTTQATDGMGVMATPDTDESWMQVAFPNGSTVSTEYKQPVTWEVPQLGSCPYCYQEGHGASGQVHAAYDIAGNYGDPVATPVSGRVVCSGYGEGPSVPGWNCNYAIGPTFEDNNGAGQVTLDVGTDSSGNQLLINTIHLAGSTVQPGQELQPGDQYGTMGSMGGMVHSHVEGLAICNGTYVYLDPTLIYNGYYNSHDACSG